jgi:hypothetical protein
MTAKLGRMRRVGIGRALRVASLALAVGASACQGPSPAGAAGDARPLETVEIVSVPSSPQ